MALSARITEAGWPARAWTSVTTPFKMVVILLIIGAILSVVWMSAGVRASVKGNV